MATPKRWVWLVVTVVLLALPGLALAQQSTDPVTAQPFVIDLEANGSVELPVYGFCLEYGKPFPGAALRPAALAQDQVRAAIAYAVGKGYVQSHVWQTQLAVWYFTNGNVKVDETYGPVADEIIAAVENGAAPTETIPGAQLLTEAVAGDALTAAIDDYKNTSPSGAYFGSGTLLLTNLTAQPLQILVPYGVQFTEEPYQERQLMAIFPQEQVTPQPTPSPTPQPELPPTGGPLAPEAGVLFAAVAGAGTLLVALARRRR